MEYRFLGRSGLKVSALSLGAWVTYGGQVADEEVAYQSQCMLKAYEAGVNFFDNAEVYANGNAETMMGKCLKRGPWKRSDLVVSTKVFWGGKGPNDTGLSRKHIIEGTNASLKRLDLDYVDLILCHRPDLFTPMEETVYAMNHLINQGKAFYWGTSEWTGEQLRQAYEVAQRHHLIPPLMEQPQYNILHRTRVEHEYLPLYRDFGLGLTTWSPLASGVLTGKYSVDKFPADSRLADPKMGWLKEQLTSGKGINMLEEKNFDTIVKKVDGLKPVAESLQCSVAQLAIAWCLKNPNVSTVITGASRVQQVEENMKALQIAQKLTPDVMEKIEKVVQNKPTPPRDFRLG